MGTWFCNSIYNLKTTWLFTYPFYLSMCWGLKRTYISELGNVSNGPDNSETCVMEPKNIQLVESQKINQYIYSQDTGSYVTFSSVLRCGPKAFMARSVWSDEHCAPVSFLSVFMVHIVRLCMVLKSQFWLKLGCSHKIKHVLQEMDNCSCKSMNFCFHKHAIYMFRNYMLSK